MDLGGFSRSSRLSVLGYSHDWPGWVYGLDLLIQLIKFVIREYMEPLSPGHTEFVQLGTNLTTYKRSATAKLRLLSITPTSLASLGGFVISITIFYLFID